MTFRIVRAAVALICATAVAFVPISPAYADQIRDDQWHLRYLNVAAAHKITQGAGVTVAVIDTGVDPHPDLQRNLMSGFDVVPGGTGDGREDLDGHGTAIAGLIAAHGRDRERGALGIAPKARIISIRYQTAKSKGNADHIANGIENAIEAGASIICIAAQSGPSTSLRNALQKAESKGVVVVAAAGNRPHDYAVAFPAFIESVVAVGATDRLGKHASNSVTGKQLDISAPGIDVYSTDRGAGYSRGQGTSASTAIVAGAAALVRSRFPQLSAEEVVHRLTATAVDKGAPGRDEEYGYGVLDLVAALTADVPSPGATAGAGPSASAQPTAAGPAGPDTAEPGDRTATLLITFGTLVVITILAAWLILRTRTRNRRTETASPPHPSGPVT